MKFVKVMCVILVILTIIMIPVNVVVRMFDNTLSLLVPGNTFWALENEDKNAILYKGEYATEADRLEAGNKLCYALGIAIAATNKFTG